MEIVGVRPKGVFITFELELQEVEDLLLSLDKARIVFDGAILGEKRAADFLSDVFYPKLEEVVKELKNGS